MRAEGPPDKGRPPGSEFARLFRAVSWLIQVQVRPSLSLEAGWHTRVFHTNARTHASHTRALSPPHCLTFLFLVPDQYLKQEFSGTSHYVISLGSSDRSV